MTFGFKEANARHWKGLIAERGKTILSMSPIEIINSPFELLIAISTKCSLSIPSPLVNKTESGSLDLNGNVMLE